MGRLAVITNSSQAVLPDTEDMGRLNCFRPPPGGNIIVVSKPSAPLRRRFGGGLRQAYRGGRAEGRWFRLRSCSDLSWDSEAHVQWWRVLPP